MSALVGLAAALLPGAVPGAHADHIDCKDHVDTAVQFTLSVDGENTDGFYALPDVKPVGLVVFSLGYGHSSYSWQHHLRRVAAELDEEGEVTAFLADRDGSVIRQLRNVAA